MRLLICCLLVAVSATTWNTTNEKVLRVNIIGKKCIKIQAQKACEVVPTSIAPLCTSLTNDSVVETCKIERSKQEKVCGCPFTCIKPTCVDSCTSINCHTSTDYDYICDPYAIRACVKRCPIIECGENCHMITIHLPPLLCTVEHGNCNGAIADKGFTTINQTTVHTELTPPSYCELHYPIGNCTKDIIGRVELKKVYYQSDNPNHWQYYNPNGASLATPLNLLYLGVLLLLHYL
jgi:hypothetical protein